MKTIVTQEKEKPLLTIITPTYNRSKLLRRCYYSLCEQTCYDFEWVIIDDGSTDNTMSIVNGFTNNRFRIIYQKKENGGKHSALNYAHSFVSGQYIMILDSDDYLTDRAVQEIAYAWKKYQDHKDIAVISFYRIHEDGSNISSKNKNDELVSDHISYRINKRKKGDQAEVIRSDLFLNFSFPIFSGEKFAPEGLLWNYLTEKYKTVYISKGIYVCEYLEKGLTSKGIKLLLENPNSMICYTKSFFNKRVCTRERIKQTWQYIIYSLYAGYKINDMIKESNQMLFTFLQLPFGMLLYIFCKKNIYNSEIFNEVFSL